MRPQYSFIQTLKLFQSCFFKDFKGVGLKNTQVTWKTREEGIKYDINIEGRWDVGRSEYGMNVKWY